MSHGFPPIPGRTMLPWGFAIVLFAGFVPILFDGRRRGFQDRLAGTVVVEATQLSFAQTRRLSRRAEYEALRESAVRRP